MDIECPVGYDHTEDQKCEVCGFDPDEETKRFNEEAEAFYGDGPYYD